MSRKYDVLIVDDEINSLKVLTAALGSDYLRVDTARSGEEAMVLCRAKRYHLIISDYRMPGMSGEDLLERTKTCCPEVSFILLTAYGTIETAVNCMRKGAFTYLTKPVDLGRLEEVVRDVLFGWKSKEVEGVDPGRMFNIIGRSAAMQEVFSLIHRVARTEANILILGESGTGKELVARAIHYSSHRADKPFFPIDCTAIPAELMESELFGYEKGAFTNATERKLGLIELAEGGTVFLDEIGDLGLALEKKLLRFLQEKDIMRVGGKKRVEVDVRVLSATNRDIEEDVEHGRFRADLYYRLNVITIRLPALRERRDDIPLLAEHYLRHFCARNNKQITGFDDEVAAALLQYDWPGNVRELENCIERAVILCPLNTINTECLPRKMRKPDEFEHVLGDNMNLLEIERRIIIKALDKTSWNQSHAAVVLGISRKQLRTKMKNMGLLGEAVEE